MSNLKQWWNVADYLDQGKNGQQFILLQMGYVDPTSGRLVNVPRDQIRYDTSEPELLYNLYNDIQYQDFEESELASIDSVQSNESA